VGQLAIELQTGFCASSPMRIGMARPVTVWLRASKRCFAAGCGPGRVARHPAGAASPMTTDALLTFVPEPGIIETK
jgi:hypothetical protein